MTRKQLAFNNGTFAVLSSMLVLFAAMIEPVVSLILAIALLLTFAFLMPKKSH